VVKSAQFSLMASHQEDSFREIQLSGKALVFLFMAVTSSLSASSLMGMLVGRGCPRDPRARRHERRARDRERAAPAALIRERRLEHSSPATAGEKLSYAERLGSQEPAKEQLKGGRPRRRRPADSSYASRESSRPRRPRSLRHRPPSTAKPAGHPQQQRPSPRRPHPFTAAASSEPAGAGFAIQVGRASRAARRRT
jgi:hypothetical protein